MVTKYKYIYTEKQREYKKQYYIENATARKEYSKKVYNKNKRQITCPNCGSILSSNALPKHQKTIKCANNTISYSTYINPFF